MIQRYEKYKDSGVSWIGEIPEHWDKTVIKRVAQFNPTRKRNLSKSELVGYVPMDRVKRGFMKPDKIHFSDVTSGLTYFEEGDIVMAKVTPCFENGNIAIAKNLQNQCAFGSSELFVFRVKNIYREYLFYLLQDKQIKDVCASTMTGTGGLKRVSSIFVKNMNIPVPPVSEQQSIVSFLDKKTSQIDSYISKKEKEIELLKEWLQAEIARVVTKGLNPNVAMKDSGVSWIGEVPEHWLLRRAKFMFNKEKRVPRECDEVITCFRDGEVTLRKNRRTTGFTNSLTEFGYQGIRKGDLVIHQMDAFAGAIGVSDSDGKGTSVYHCCTSKGKYLPFYYAYLIRIMAHSGYIQSLYRGIRERSSDFNFKVFGDQSLLIPSLSEQQSIVNYIDEKKAKVDKMISAIQAEINHLKEYKQSLISDVVTGKIKVTP